MDEADVSAAAAVWRMDECVQCLLSSMKLSFSCSVDGDHDRPASDGANEAGYIAAKGDGNGCCRA